MNIPEEFKERKPTVIITGVVLFISLVIIWGQTCSTTLKLDHTLFNGLGQVTAEEAIMVVSGRGRIVAVINNTYTIAGGAPHDVWRTFQRELKKHNGVSLSATESVEPDPGDGSPRDCPSAAFKKLMEQHADADAIVFFISLPDWKWLQQHQLIPQRLPPHVIVVDTGALPAQGHYTDYFANGFVSELIAARQGLPPAASANPRQPREWFDQYFQVYTPENYEALAAAGANR